MLAYLIEGVVSKHIRFHWLERPDFCHLISTTVFRVKCPLRVWSSLATFHVLRLVSIILASFWLDCLLWCYFVGVKCGSCPYSFNVIVCINQGFFGDIWPTNLEYFFDLLVLHWWLCCSLHTILLFFFQIAWHAVVLCGFSSDWRRGPRWFGLDFFTEERFRC